MLDQPLTVGSLIIINSATVLPLLILIGKGVWYLSKMTHQHDQMWNWFSSWGGDTRDRRDRRDRREEIIPVPHNRRQHARDRE